MTVGLVVTEHSSFLTKERTRRYEGIREQLEHSFGVPVAMAHYRETERLDGVHALVLSGSNAPWAAHDARELDELGRAVNAFEGAVLGICAGMQLQAMFAGGAFGPASGPDRAPENGYLAIDVLDDADLLAGLPPRPTVFQHHTDEITALPDGFCVLARSPKCPVQAIARRDRRWWGTQFHPEVFRPDYPAGERVLQNFIELAELSP